MIKIGHLASEIFKFKSVKFLSLKGKQLQNEWSDSAQIRTRQSFYACPDDDSIKNEYASTETLFLFSHYKSMGDLLDAQGQLTLAKIQTRPRFYACPRYL